MNIALKYKYEKKNKTTKTSLCNPRGDSLEPFRFNSRIFFQLDHFLSSQSKLCGFKLQSKMKLYGFTVTQLGIGEVFH